LLLLALTGHSSSSHLGHGMKMNDDDIA